MKIFLNSILMLKKNILLEHIKPVHFHGHYGCFCPTTAELSSCKRDRMAHNAINIYYLTL